MNIILATHNKGKLTQFKKLLLPLINEGYNIISCEVYGYIEDIEETGTTYEENAIIKAKTISQKYNVVALSEDSGMEVTALNKRPGVYTARYGGENITKLEKLEMLLKEMEGKTDRSAKFVSVLCAYFPDNTYITVRGEITGKISHKIDNLDGGLAFTPIFIKDGHKSAMSNLTPDQLILENHRGKATKLFIPKFLEYVSKKQF